MAKGQISISLSPTALRNFTRMAKAKGEPVSAYVARLLEAMHDSPDYLRAIEAVERTATQ